MTTQIQALTNTVATLLTAIAAAAKENGGGGDGGGGHSGGGGNGGGGGGERARSNSRVTWEHTAQCMAIIPLA